VVFFFLTANIIEYIVPLPPPPLIVKSLRPCQISYSFPLDVYPTCFLYTRNDYIAHATVKFEYGLMTEENAFAWTRVVHVNRPTRRLPKTRRPQIAGFRLSRVSPGPENVLETRLRSFSGLCGSVRCAACSPWPFYTRVRTIW